MHSKHNGTKADGKFSKPVRFCIICGKPATRVLDDDASCEEHLELVYEDQVEKYTASHLKEDEWLEKI